MRICFIGSGIEREETRLDGIEVDAVARVIRSRFDELVFGGSNVGLMADFADAFRGAGGTVVSVAPRWLEDHGLLYTGGELVICDDLAERKRIMFDEVDAVLCYPGGVGTWDELFDLIARHAVTPGQECPPIYLYNWEKFFAPILLQVEVAVEMGLVHEHAVTSVHPFESVDSLARFVSAGT
jgi:uncharacterized protein (TIGR00730 family)